ncbi:MAG: glycosyltransferase family 2 protein, partial [Deltaproteobacteria bacterium]|nr:glycosyltransferase family 2 protein [Deltaproteobacteria bacterium]
LLKQLKAQRLRDEVEVVIVVVVDGSTDGTLEMLGGRFPGVRVVRGDGDWWYTRSMNEGFMHVEKLSVDHVLAMNDDCQIQDTYIETLVEAVEKAGKNSVVGSLCLTVGKPHRVFFSGIKRINWALYSSDVYHRFLSPCDPDRLSGLHPSVVLPGRGMLIPMKILKRLDYFDETFPQYGSDDDFCLRCLEKNVGVYVSWDSRVYNEPQRTGSGSAFVKQPFFVFLKGFFYKYSRTYIKKEMVRLWRHGDKVFFPVAFTILIRKRFTDYFFGPKVVSGDLGTHDEGR